MGDGAGNSLGQLSVIISGLSGICLHWELTGKPVLACFFLLYGGSRRYCWNHPREEMKTSYRVEHLVHDWLSDPAVHVTRLRLFLTILTV